MKMICWILLLIKLSCCVCECSVSAKVGDDVVLPVHLKTKLSTSDLKVSWQRNNKVVHTYRHGRDYLDNQNENFKGRTSMFEDEMAEGNVSLRLKNVTEEDAGTYICTVVMKYDEKEDSVSLTAAHEPQTQRPTVRPGPESRGRPGLYVGLGLVLLAASAVLVVCVIKICVIESVGKRGNVSAVV